MTPKKGAKFCAKFHASNSQILNYSTYQVTEKEALYLRRDWNWSMTEILTKGTHIAATAASASTKGRYRVPKIVRETPGRENSASKTDLGLSAVQAVDPSYQAACRYAIASPSRTRATRTPRIDFNVSIGLCRLEVR